MPTTAKQKAVRNLTEPDDDEIETRRTSRKLRRCSPSPKIFDVSVGLGYYIFVRCFLPDMTTRSDLPEYRCLLARSAYIH